MVPDLPWYCRSRCSVSALSQLYLPVTGSVLRRISLETQLFERLICLEISVILHPRLKQVSISIRSHFSKCLTLPMVRFLKYIGYIHLMLYVFSTYS